MRCPVAREHLHALQTVDRTIGLAVKYALIPATVAAAALWNQAALSNWRYVVGIGVFALGTLGLHAAYRLRPREERVLVPACVILECFYVVVISLTFRQPLEVLAAFPLLKVVQVIDTRAYHAGVVAAGLAVLVGSMVVLYPGGMAVPAFGWEAISLLLMLGSGMVFADYLRGYKCPSCAITRMRGSFISQLIGAQEDGRKQIARDLHDVNSQNLAALIVNLDLLDQSLPRSLDAAHAHIERIKEIANATLEDAHRIIYRLRPAVLDDLGLEAAVRSCVRHLADPQGIAAQVEARGLADCRLPQTVETSAFRIVQEALTNSVRHAGARSIRVRLECRAGGLHGLVQDDGHGFDSSRMVEDVADRKTFGLIGMQERAILLDGWLRVRSRKGRGTSVEFDLPTRPVRTADARQADPGPGCGRPRHCA